VGDIIGVENWEGTHNALLMQGLRDMHKYRVHEPFLAMIEELAKGSAHEAVMRERVQDFRARLDHVLGQDPLAASIAWRPLADDMTGAFWAAASIEHLGRMGLEGDALAVAEASLAHFVAHRVAPDEPARDRAYLEHISLLARSI